MKKQKKSSGGKNRRQQGNGQADRMGQAPRKTEQKTARAGSGQAGDQQGTRSQQKETSTQHPQARRKPQRGVDDKRQLWDRKQAELAARRAAAESRRIEEDNARRRKAKIVFGATGMTTALLACTLAWYFV
ncbi:hypothetical protein [Noviherbaspirillum aerium]|uniref:hypothetical protein n=1 Tax=Noviherbaspirillum aerium TaxID=2588497 RepID=UPI00124CDE65|nr:hypothetical protein [Noviherbaspirillum aerium]